MTKAIEPPAKGVKSLVDPGEEAVATGTDLNPDLHHGYDPDDSPTRAAAAVALAVDGAPYADIARICGYSSPFRARQAVERTLAEGSDSPEERVELRRLIDRRLNRLLYAVMPKAVDETHVDQLAFSRQALAIIDRQARLHGVDAPSSVAVFTPNADEVNRYVAQMVTIARQAQAREAEIWDAEVIEG
jgi:hypothetical protein